MRQLIIARKDLQMSPGKLAAQCCHASLAFLTDPIGMGQGVEPIEKDGEITGYRAEIMLEKATYEEWFDGSFTKTICGAKNRNQLLKAKTIAEELGLVEHKDFFLCYTSFCSKVKVLCCIIENCYSTAAARCKGSKIALFSVLKVVSVRSQCFARRCGCTAGG